jgi:hypothetical protein
VEYSSTLDRGLVLVAAAMAVTAPFIGRWPAAVALVVAGALALNMGIVNVRDIAGHRYEYGSYPDAAVGIGLYLVLAGGVVALLAAVVAAARH